MARRRHPVQPVYSDENGTIRFQPNKIVQTLLHTGKLTLNDIASMDFSREDHVQLAQLIGYSVSGFGDLSYVHDDDYQRAQKKVRKLIEKEKQDVEKKEEG